MKELYKTTLGTVTMTDTSTLKMVDRFGHTGFIHMSVDGVISIWTPEGDHVEKFACKTYPGKEFVHVNLTSMDNFTKHVWVFVSRISILRPMRSFLSSSENFLADWGTNYMIPMLRSAEIRQYA